MTAETSNARWDVVAERQAWYEQQIALAEGQWAAAFLDRWECGDDVPSKEHYVALWLAERAAPPPAAAEPKTLPVPTHVYLTDKAAVIVGDPQCGWDEEGPDAHNCDAMGCASIGPHVLARVPFTDERSLAAAQQGQAVAECHCATCTCAPGMTPAVRFDTSPAAQEGAVRDHLIALGWTPPGAQQPAAVDEAYPTPRNRAEAVALARLALAHLGVIDAHIDAAIARCETNSAAQPGGAE